MATYRIKATEPDQFAQPLYWSEGHDGWASIEHATTYGDHARKHGFLPAGGEWELIGEPVPDAIRSPLRSPDDRDRIIAELCDTLDTAIGRVYIANAEGNPILSAWVGDAEQTVRRARAYLPGAE